MVPSSHLPFGGPGVFFLGTAASTQPHHAPSGEWGGGAVDALQAQMAGLDQAAQLP